MTTATAALMTTTAALALYDGATDDSARLEAAACMADAIRRLPADAAAPRAKAARKPKASGGVVNAQNLIAALKRINAVVERRNSIPILSYVRLEAKGGRMVLTATDLDLEYCETLTDAPELGEFAICVESHALAAALKGCAGGISLKPREGFSYEAGAVLTAGGIETMLPTLPAGDFPALSRDGDVMSATMPTADFLGALGFVRGCISTEETRYYLNGAYMHVTTDAGTDQLTFASTDGHRLLQAKLPTSAGFPKDMPGTIIPRKTVEWVVKHMAADDEIQVDVLSVGGSGPVKIQFTTATGSLVSKLIEGSFPDYYRVIPRDRGTSLIEILDAPAVREVVARVLSVSREKMRSLKVVAEKGAVRVSARNMDGGKAEAELPATGATGADMEIGFNGSYVLDMLTLGAGAVLHLSDEVSPSRVEWPDQPGRLGVLMPLRV